MTYPGDVFAGWTDQGANNVIVDTGIVDVKDNLQQIGIITLNCPSKCINFVTEINRTSIMILSCQSYAMQPTHMPSNLHTKYITSHSPPFLHMDRCS